MPLEKKRVFDYRIYMQSTQQCGIHLDDLSIIHNRETPVICKKRVSVETAIEHCSPARPQPCRHTELAIARSSPATRPVGRSDKWPGSGQHWWWLWSARSKCRLVYIMATAQRFRLTPRAGGTFDLGPFAVSPPLLRCCRRRRHSLASKRRHPAARRCLV